jgi:hypothetical protein
MGEVAGVYLTWLDRKGGITIVEDLKMGRRRGIRFLRSWKEEVGKGKDDLRVEPDDVGGSLIVRWMRRKANSGCLVTRTAAEEEVA